MLDMMNVYAYCDGKPTRLVDPTGLLSTLPQGLKLKRIDDKCACCCCPNSITAAANVIQNVSGWFRYTQALDITFTIKMTYSKAPQGAKDINCAIAFAEFIDPVTTDKLVPRGMTEGVWIDQVAADPDKFDKWRDFNPPAQQTCSGSATITLTDHSSATLKAGEIFKFWQLVGVLGGRGCKCKPAYVAVLTNVLYDPNQKSGTDPTMTSYPVPVKPLPAAPQGVFPLPSW